MDMQTPAKPGHIKIRMKNYRGTIFFLEVPAESATVFNRGANGEKPYDPKLYE